MHRTIFDTPGVNTLLRVISISFLKATGWKIVGELPPNCRKSVFDCGAPHQQLGFALYVDGELRTRPEYLLDG